MHIYPCFSSFLVILRLKHIYMILQMYYLEKIEKNTVCS